MSLDLSKITRQLRALYEVCTLGYFMPGSIRDRPYRAFGFGNGALLVEGPEGLDTFSESLDAIRRSTARIQESIAPAELEELVVATIWRCRKEGTVPVDKCSQELVDAILQRPEQEWTAVRPVGGANIRDRKEVALGPFTLFSSSQVAERIQDGCATFEPEYLDLRNWAPLAISLTVRARSDTHANLLADREFGRFESIVAFMLGTFESPTRVLVGFRRQLQVRESVVFSADRWSMGASVHGAIREVDLGSGYFTSPEHGNDRFWGVTQRIVSGASDLCEMERRLIRAVEWIGRALQDEDPSKALVQMVFAIESLLQSDQEGMIRPSIVSQIAEWAAFILGETFEARCDTEKRVKDLYSHRSAVAHGGKHEVSELEVNRALEVSSGLARAFAVREKLRGIQTAHELRSVIQAWKYN